MRYVTFAVAMLAAGSAGAAEFQMDKTGPEIRAAIKKPAIVDLAVGEAGIKNQPLFCVQDGKLFIVADLPLDDKKREYGVSFKVKRLPNESVSLEAFKGAYPKETTLALDIADTLNDALIGTCEAKAVFGPTLLLVQDINGKSKASDFLR